MRACLRVCVCVCAYVCACVCVCVCVCVKERERERDHRPSGQRRQSACADSHGETGVLYNKTLYTVHSLVFVVGYMLLNIVKDCTKQ